MKNQQNSYYICPKPKLLKDFGKTGNLVRDIVVSQLYQSRSLLNKTYFYPRVRIFVISGEDSLTVSMKSLRRMESFKEESKSDVYDGARDRWEVRTDYLASQILLHRGNVGPAEALIQMNFEITRTEHSRKMEGSFVRLLGEVRFRLDEIDSAIANLNEAILILKEVGNPQQLWQAHASLASAFYKQGRPGEAREHWVAAAEVIRSLANSLSDRELREGFLQAEPIREMLSKAES